MEQTPKNVLSSDGRLQPACMKMELLVIADQHAAVITFPGFVHTARDVYKRQDIRVGVGGAAGWMAAGKIRERGGDVILFEKMNRTGKMCIRDRYIAI